MMSLRKEDYASADVWYEAVVNDYCWLNRKARMEADLKENGVTILDSYRNNAKDNLEKATPLFYFWDLTHSVQDTVREVWEERFTLGWLKAQVIYLLTLQWVDDAILNITDPKPKRQKVEEEFQICIFSPDLDTNKLKLGIHAIWNKPCEFEKGAPKEWELLEYGNEWICFYKLFLDLGWLANPDRSAFCLQMQKWFGLVKRGRLQPCKEENLKKLDPYIKDVAGKNWNVNDRRYQGQITKLQEKIFIYSELKKEFTYEKYGLGDYTTST